MKRPSMDLLLFAVLGCIGCAKPVAAPALPAPPAYTMTAYEVELTWQAPASSGDPVAGYFIWRSTTGADYQLLNATPATSMVYVDRGVKPSTVYDYYVTSVDAEGNQSAPSNIWSVAIPTPCNYANPGSC